jgi:ribosome biogenesis protein NSA1
VSNATGHVESLDLASRKMQCAIKGIAGSVRQLRLHPTEPLLASVGLDRFLRVHSTETRQLLAKVHLKQQLTGVCWLPVESAERQEAALEAQRRQKQLEQQQEQQQQQQQEQGGEEDREEGGEQRAAGEAGGKRKGKPGRGKGSKKARR